MTDTVATAAAVVRDVSAAANDIAMLLAALPLAAMQPGGSLHTAIASERNSMSCSQLFACPAVSFGALLLSQRRDRLTSCEQDGHLLWRRDTHALVLQHGWCRLLPCRPATRRYLLLSWQWHISSSHLPKRSRGRTLSVLQRSTTGENKRTGVAHCTAAATHTASGSVKN